MTKKQLIEGAIFQVENGKLVEKKNSALIDLKDCAVYIVKRFLLTKVTPKSFGEDVLLWKHGEVIDINRSQRVVIEGQEVI